MNPVEKALWFIEAHSDKAISLDDIAAAAGVSRFHLVRAFGIVHGRSVMRYLRARRLSEAAKAVAAGTDRLIDVALDAGYQSHEAFTRAFREAFGVPPEALRQPARLATLDLTEPLAMNETLLETLAAPRFENRKLLLAVGRCERYDQQASAKIPAQWQRFSPMIGHIPGQIGEATYGIVCNSDEDGSIDYFSAVEVRDFSDVPSGLSTIRLPPQRYAVFAHDGHVSAIRQVWMTIFSRWMPESGQAPADAPSFERYGPDFDPRTGSGRFEIWVPLAA